MKRQAWILSAWATLGSSLLAGCVRPTGDRRPPEIPILPTRLQSTQAQASLQSPYHAQPAELLARSKNGSGVVRTRHAIEIPADPQAVPGTEPQERVVERPGPERDPQPPPRPRVVSPDPTAEKPEPAKMPPVAASKPDPLLEAFCCFRDRRDGEAVRHLGHLTPLSRDVLATLLPLAGRCGSIGLENTPPGEVAELLGQLERVSQVLRPRAALSLERMCFCRTIEGFGVYEPLPAEHAFQPGGQNRSGELVQVYVELKNFTTRQVGQFYETNLAVSLELRTYQGELVWRQDRPARPDRSRSPRQDCFLNCHFYVPPRVPAGDYVLWVQVKDMTAAESSEVPAHRKARRSLDFHIAGGGVARSP